MSTPAVTDADINAALRAASAAWITLVDTLTRADAIQRAVVLAACPLTELTRRDIMLTLQAWAGVAAEELHRARIILELAG